MSTEPTTASGDSAVGRHRRSTHWLARVGAGRAMIAVAAVLAAASVGLLVAASWGIGDHSALLPPDGVTFARDVAAPQPLTPSTPVDGSNPPTATPAASPSAAATPTPSSGAATGGAGRAAPSKTSQVAAPAVAPTPTGRPVVSYEAEARGNARSSGTGLRRVSRASGGYVVGGLGQGETLRFAVNAPATGRYALTLYYIAGERRGATMSVNGGRVVGGLLPSTGDWNTVGSVTVPVNLVSGGNTIEFGNPRSPAPDFDRIVLR